MEAFNESPKQRSNAFAPRQQLHQSHDTKQSKEIDRNYASSLLSARRHRLLTRHRVHLRIDDVDEASEDNDEIENVPSVAKVIFKAKCGEFEDKFEREDGGEDHVEDVEDFGVFFWLSIELHRERDCVDHDENENCVFEWLRRHKPPNFVLNSVLWNVSARVWKF